MKLSENKLFKNTVDLFPVFTYGSIILTWVSEIHNKYNFQFLYTLEKKLGLEIIMLIIGFLLIGIGTNEKKTNEKYLYFGLFALSSIIVIIASWDSIEILLSMIVILINHLVSFLSQTGDYGAEGGENIINGRGPIFRFCLVCIYGIPVGLLIQYRKFYDNRFVLGYAVVGYYFILLLFELRYFIKQYIKPKRKKK